MKRQLKDGQFHLKQPQIEKLIEATTNRRDRLIIRLLAETGIRRHECAALEISDFKASKGAIRVLGKGDKERLIPASVSLKQEVDFFVKETYGGLKKGYLFKSSHRASGTGHITPEIINRIVKEAGIKAGLKNPNPRLSYINPHLLRHSFAYRFKTFLGLDALAMVLGHESPATTAKIYGLPAFEDIKKAMAKSLDSQKLVDPAQISLVD